MIAGAAGADLSKEGLVGLTFQSRRVEEITVVECTGRIVEGPESEALQQQVTDLIAESPYIILHLGGIDFIDSSGLGLLVRCLIRTEHVHGVLRLCAAPSRIREALTMTGLNTVFQIYPTEEDAIAGFYRSASGDRRAKVDANILCVEQSANVLAYVGQLLRQAGYVVVTTGNLPDALTLLTATRPKLVIVSAPLRAQRTTRAAERFNEIADSLRVIQLPADFSIQEAGHAGRVLLDEVRAVLGPSGAPAPAPA
jgi:anti-sigma B factor antagonist